MVHKSTINGEPPSASVQTYCFAILADLRMTSLLSAQSSNCMFAAAQELPLQPCELSEAGLRAIEFEVIDHIDDEQSSAVSTLIAIRCSWMPVCLFAIHP